MRVALVVFWGMVSLLLVLPAAPGSAIAQEGPIPSATDEPGESPEAEPSDPLEEIVVTRTPEPTITPGVISEQVSELTTRVGIQYVEVLGLSSDDWINLGVSVAIVLGGYVLGTLLIRRLLPKLVARTTTRFDDKFLEAVGSDLRWLVVILALSFGTRRLIFVGAGLKRVLADVYFIAGLYIAVRIVWRLIDLTDNWATSRAVVEGREDTMAPITTLMVRLARVVLVIGGVIILLSHFGINVTAFVAVLGIGGLAISLAAQDTIADAISGFIILVDQPFRIGDRIEIESEGTWGDVVEIGLRTTRIRTRDNRMVIVPNSVIGKNQVINYTYPDPQYRIQTHVAIAYGTDIELLRRIIVDTVRQVDDILPDKPVDALYVEMGESAMIFRVRWWIDSYIDTRHIIDKVNTALQAALDEAEIVSPFPTRDLNVHLDAGTAGRLSRVDDKPIVDPPAAGDQPKI